MAATPSSFDATATIEIIHKVINSSEVLATPEEVARLQQALDPQAATPVHIRVRIIQALSHQCGVAKQADQKTFNALIAVLSSDVPLLPLQQAAISALVSIGTVPTSKQAEIVREISDVLIQVALPSGGFAAEIQLAAREGLRTLASGSLRGVTMKIFHLLSDEREADTAEQIAEERAFALDLLHELTASAKYVGHWNSEAVAGVVKLISVILPTVTAAQYVRMVECALAIPEVRDNGGARLVESIAAALRLGDATQQSRSFQSVVLLASHIPRTTTGNALAEKLFPLIRTHLATPPATEADLPLVTDFAKALVLAARMASEELAGEACANIAASVVAFSPDGNPVGWSLVEALLVSLTFTGHRNAKVLLQVLHDAGFIAAVTALHATAAATQKQLQYVAAKQAAAQSSPATGQLAEAVRSVTNVATITQALAAKKLPSIALLPSWESATKKAVPAAIGSKRDRL